MPTLAFIGGMGPWELMIILVIVLILFGAGRLPQVFKALGEGVKAFRDGQRDDAIDVSPQIGKDLDAEGQAQREHEPVGRGARS